jgi:phage tail protein X
VSEVVQVRRDGVTVDLIVWERFGRTAELVEETLALNPGLAAAGPVLPLLTRVRLPSPPPARAVPVRSVVRLWDE